MIRLQKEQTYCNTYSFLLPTSSTVCFVSTNATKLTKFLDVPTLASAMLEQSDPYKQFLGLLSNSNNPEDPIPLLTATFLTNLISISITSSGKVQKRDDEALPKLYSYLSTLIKAQDAGLQDIGVQHCSSLLRSTRAKELFWKQKQETVDPLFEILRKAAGSSRDSDSTRFGSGTSIRSVDTKFAGGVGLQLMYHVLLVVWQLSFESKLVGQGLEKFVFQAHNSFRAPLIRTGTKM